MANFSLFSKNGVILPVAEATVSLFDIEYSYGYGVYETLKVRKGVLYFVDQHLERLEHSAKVLDITLPYSSQQIKENIQELVKLLETDACNIKMLVLGGKQVNIYIFASAPLFPDRKLYSQGAKLISHSYERLFPTAKTLNMLPSYMAYKKALEHGCYDALLTTQDQQVLEGTRTNFCLVKGKTIFRAPGDQVLGGVTFLTLERVAQKEGFQIEEAKIYLKDIASYDGAFITSTSTKIMPVAQIDDVKYPEIAPAIKTLMAAYDNYLDQSNGLFV